MSTSSMADLLNQAKEAGFVSGSLLTATTQAHIRAKLTNVKPKAGGKVSLGVMIEVLSGATAGESGWLNQNFDASNPKVIGFFFRFLNDFGISDEEIVTYPEGEEGVKAIAARLQGVELVADIVQTPWSTDKTKFSNDLRNTSLVSALAAVPAVAVPAVPAVPAAVPAVPVPAPVAPVAAVEVPAVPAPVAAIPQPVLPPPAVAAPGTSF